MYNNKEPFVCFVVRYIICIGLVLISLKLFYGCASAPATIVEYRDVLVPVKCKILLPERPLCTEGSPAACNLEIIKYIRLLEESVRVCL